ncbi:MAG: hypothetical protein ABW173_03595 [Sphingomonas sp.]
MKRFAVGLTASLMVAGPACAAPSPMVRAVQAAAGLAPPAEGVARFTVIQPEGRGATIFEAERDARGVRRTIIDLMPAPGGAWSVGMREARPLAAETFDYFRGLIDAALRAETPAEPCAAGPNYYAEHGANGVAGCGAEGGVPAIARAMGLADAVTP